MVTHFKANGFLLSLCSPVLHHIISPQCAPGSSLPRSAEVADVDGSVLLEVLELWCGKRTATDKSLPDALLMGSVADTFEVAEVAAALEELIAAHLAVAVCEEAVGRLGENVPVEEATERPWTGGLLGLVYEVMAASCSELEAGPDPAASSDGMVSLSRSWR